MEHNPKYPPVPYKLENIKAMLEKIALSDTELTDYEKKFCYDMTTKCVDNRPLSIKEYSFLRKIYINRAG